MNELNGAELDQAVALAVIKPEWVAIINGECWIVPTIINGIHDDRRLWDPSTDIADAWKIVEIMQRRYHVGIDSLPGPLPWRCTIASLSVDEETACLAICRAALLVPT